MKLVLLRHGETDWNRQGRLMSVTDLGLSSEGRSHASEVRLGMAASGLDYVVSSPAIRALETARLAATANGLQGLPFEVRPDLHEMDFGDFEGLTHVGLQEDGEFSEVFRSWYSDDPHAAVPPHGETWAAAFARAKGFLSYAFDRGESALVVSHGYQLRLVIVAALAIEHPSAIRRFALGNACHSILERRESGPWRLKRHNVCSWASNDS